MHPDLPASLDPIRRKRRQRMWSRIALWGVAAAALFLLGEHLRVLLPVETRVEARPHAPTLEAVAGAQPLGLGGPRLVNRRVQWRDGLLYVPEAARSGRPLPLLLWLHGGGGRAEEFRFMLPLAEALGVVLVLLDARHNTWDAIDSPFGVDVRFIDETLAHIFDHVRIDPQRIALGGLSDGASYALALGRVNGDLFTHLIAAAPGHLAPPGPPVGQPRVLVVHGRRDTVYHIDGSRRLLVPDLRSRGYDVTFIEFDGPHYVHAPVARTILEWLTAPAQR